MNLMYICTCKNSTFGSDTNKFLEFLTPENMYKVYDLHFPNKPRGYHYSVIFPSVVEFFTTLAWTKPGFYIMFTISEVVIPNFGAVYILKPRFLFSYIFLLLRFYVVEELEVDTLDGKDLSKVKLGNYYIMYGDILFSPIRLDRWQRVTKDKILSKNVPSFIVEIFYHYFCLDVNTMTISKSKKGYLLYDKSRHSWSNVSKI